MSSRSPDGRRRSSPCCRAFATSARGSRRFAITANPASPPICRPRRSSRLPIASLIAARTWFTSAAAISRLASSAFRRASRRPSTSTKTTALPLPRRRAWRASAANAFSPIGWSWRVRLAIGLSRVGRPRFRRAFVASSEDGRRLARRHPGWSGSTSGMQSRFPLRRPKRNDGATLLFVGGLGYAPERGGRAVVLPRSRCARLRAPSARSCRLWIAGAGSPAVAELTCHPRVNWLGRVDRVAPLYENARPWRWRRCAPAAARASNCWRPRRTARRASPRSKRREAWIGRATRQVGALARPKLSPRPAAPPCPTPTSATGALPAATTGRAGATRATASSPGWRGRCRRSARRLRRDAAERAPLQSQGRPQSERGPRRLRHLRRGDSAGDLPQSERRGGARALRRPPISKRRGGDGEAFALPETPRADVAAASRCCCGKVWSKSFRKGRHRSWPRSARLRPTSLY